MKLNSEGKLARFYSWNYWGKLPNNFCVFFWKILVAALVFPLTLPALLSREMREELVGTRVALGFLGYVTLAIISALVWLVFVNPISLVFPVGFALALITTTFLIPKLIRSELVEEITGVFKEKTKSVKDGYCPRIDWE